MGSTFLSVGKMLVFYGLQEGSVLTIQFASFSPDVTIGWGALLSVCTCVCMCGRKGGGRWEKVRVQRVSRWDRSEPAGGLGPPGPQQPRPPSLLQSSCLLPTHVHVHLMVFAGSI
jgi:hypothetical protein